MRDDVSDLRYLFDRLLIRAAKSSNAETQLRVLIAQSFQRATGRICADLMLAAITRSAPKGFIRSGIYSTLDKPEDHLTFTLAALKREEWFDSFIKVVDAVSSKEGAGLRGRWLADLRRDLERLLKR